VFSREFRAVVIDLLLVHVMFDHGSPFFLVLRMLQRPCLVFSLLCIGGIVAAESAWLFTPPDLFFLLPPPLLLLQRVPILRNRSPVPKRRAGAAIVFFGLPLRSHRTSPEQASLEVRRLTVLMDSHFSRLSVPVFSVTWGASM